MCYDLILQNVWRRTARSAAVHQTDALNVTPAIRRTRRDNAVRIQLYSICNGKHCVLLEDIYIP